VSALIGLQCHLCKTAFPAEATYVCDRCLGPLEPVYDYSSIHLTREIIASRPKNLWRYRELLPITGEPKTGLHSGFTPLVRCTASRRASRHSRAIHQGRLGQSSDAFIQRSRRLRGSHARGRARSRCPRCASTGNLANSVAAHAARLGLECCVFIPDNLEAGKVLGSAIFGPTILAINGKLRRCEPAVHAGGGSPWLGIREHQSAVVLRGGRKDARL